MKTMGLVAAFVDVPQEHTEDYNRWYDFDHVPEYVALPEFLSARRYVATPDLKKLRPESSLEDIDAEMIIWVNSARPEDGVLFSQPMARYFVRVSKVDGCPSCGEDSDVTSQQVGGPT